MNLKKIILYSLFVVFLNEFSYGQGGKGFSFNLFGSYLVPKKELRQVFHVLKGLEINIQLPIKANKGGTLSYYSGYKWGGKSENSLESKLNVDRISLGAYRGFKEDRGVSFYSSANVGYEVFRYGYSVNEKRIQLKRENISLSFDVGTNLFLNKKKKIKLYFGIEKDFFLSRRKDLVKFSNFKLKSGLKFNFR